MKILLVGNPNVGKSVLFSRLTGAKVIASNYAGTTVEISRGYLELNGPAEIIDSPGAYTLDPTNRAEEVTLKLIGEADYIINVIDATNLERNLSFTMELISKIKKPVIAALNMWDETKHRGIEIDWEKLSVMLGMAVIPVCALTGEGVNTLLKELKKAGLPHSEKLTGKDKWQVIGELISSAQRLRHRHHSFWDILEEFSVKPPWAYILAAGITAFSFKIIRLIGEGLINHVFDPFFNNFYSPLVVNLSNFLKASPFLHGVLIGTFDAGSIDYGTAFGLLTTGLYVPIAMVFPYVFSFYLILGVLEDSGYLPRLAVISDRLFHKIGLHGYAIVPTVLGIGCNVPGALAIRLFEAGRERFIAATLLAIAVPCMAQISVIIGILARFGGQYVLLVFLNLFVIGLVLGRILNKRLPGKSPEILVEIPPYRRPALRALVKKMWIRLRWFFSEAIPYVLLGVLLVNLLYYFKIIDFFAYLFSPVLTSIWGLPREAVGAFIVGFLRKDVAVGMLRPLGLSVRQLIVGCTVLAVYFPCMGTFIVLLRELGLKDMLKSISLMLITALVAGGVINLIGILTGMG